MLYQPPPLEAYSPPHISIDGTNLSAVEHFTYPCSVITDDATVSKDLDNRSSKASSSFGRLSKRAWQSHSLRLSTKLQAYRTVLVITLLYGVEPGVSIGSRSGYCSGSTNAACASPLASNGKTTCQTKFSREPACPTQSPSCVRCSFAWPATSQGCKTYACPKQSSSASSKTEIMILVLQERVTKTS